MTTKAQQAEQQEAIERLLERVKPGQRVYTVLNHVSKSGMMRHISLKIVVDGDICDITWLVAKAMDERIAPNGGIKVGGCGMDMGFDLVYRLGYKLWPNGTAKPHGSRNGEPDSCGGYALHHSWL